MTRSANTAAEDYTSLSSARIRSVVSDSPRYHESRCQMNVYREGLLPDREK